MLFLKLCNPKQFLIKSSTIRKLLISVLSAAVLVFFQLGVNVVTLAQPQTGLPTYQPLEQIPATAQQVKTGIYAVNLYSLDPSSNTYYLDFYIWFKWKGDLDPIEKLEFTNNVEHWSFTLVPTYEKPDKLPDGNFYQILRAEGRFREPFVFTRYPLDWQSLGITLENSVYTKEQLIYLADTEASGYIDNLSVPGWNIRSYQLKNLTHQYITNFGDTRFQSNESVYSALRYELLVSRPISFFLWKLLLPVLIVLCSSWGALLLYPLYVDSRILLPSTALLTIVFLQLSYSDGLPDVGYLVLLDKIYVLVYVLIITAILEAILTANWAKSENTEDVTRVIVIDRYFLIGSLIILAVGITLLILLN